MWISFMTCGKNLTKQKSYLIKEKIQTSKKLLRLLIKVYRRVCAQFKFSHKGKKERLKNANRIEAEKLDIQVILLHLKIL